MHSIHSRRNFLRNVAGSTALGTALAMAGQSDTAEPLRQRARVWEFGQEDDGSLHALGNGDVIAYGRGPHFEYFFGPPYTSPNLFRAEVRAQAGRRLRTESLRKPRTAIWEHRVELDGRPVGKFLDCVLHDLPVLCRRVDITSESITLHITTNHEMYPLQPGTLSGLDAAGQAWLIMAPRGSLTSGTPYASTQETYAICAFTGVAKGQQDSEGLNIEFSPGRSELLVAGGPEMPAAVANVERCLAQSRDEQIQQTENWWRGFSASHTELADSLPDTAPHRDYLAYLIDSVAVLLKTQQSRQGAETAGHFWMLGYARDHYGVHRAFLTLRHPEAAKAILAFQFRKFGLFGRVHTAYGIGVDSIVHRHENDEVEITGYTILQAAEYSRASGDDDFARQLFPMLDYCWRAQVRNLKGDLLGFNGDESYVAGGLLPRSALQDGSAEANLLFIRGGEWLADWAGKQKLWREDYASEQRRIIEAVKKQWRQSFIRGDRLVTNAPERARLDQPRFRHGVCEAGPHYLLWTQRTPEGRYIGPRHLASGASLPAIPAETFELPAVALASPWYNSDLVSRELLQNYTDRILAETRPGPMPVFRGARGFLGYEPGLLLHALTTLGHPARREFYDVTMRLADSTGAWAEHYEKDGSYRGTRYRQWESGVNIEALIGSARAATR
jgi:hypothetical protein